MAAEQGLARSVEEEKILRDIREEKESLWIEIQVGKISIVPSIAVYELCSCVCVRVGTTATDHRY